MEINETLNKLVENTEEIKKKIQEENYYENQCKHKPCVFNGAKELVQCYIWHEQGNGKIINRLQD